MSQQNKTIEDTSTTESISEPQKASKSVALKLEGEEVEIPLTTLSRRQRRSNRDLLSIAEHLNVDPFEILLHAASGNHKALGYEEPRIHRTVGEGITEEEVLPMSLRIQAAKEAAQYLYPKKRSIEFSPDESESAQEKFTGSILELIEIAKGS